jgi:L-threonylcarbamoyladenylate synthase
VAERIPFQAPLPAETLEAIEASLRSGGVLGIPTDTLYGLAADPLSETGVTRIFNLKSRPASKAMPVLIGNLGQLEALGVSESPWIGRLRTIWPAPLTVILNVKRPIPASGGLSSLAIRMPAHELLLAMLERVGPLTATSANKSGEKPAESAKEVVRRFGFALSHVLDGGPLTGLPSTLVDLSGASPVILRSGAFRWPPKLSI